VLFCKRRSLPPSFKVVFLQNLFALLQIFLSFISYSTSSSSFFELHSLDSIHQYSSSYELQGELVRTNLQKYYEPVRTNSLFAISQDNYVTSPRLNEINKPRLYDYLNLFPSFFLKINFRSNPCYISTKFLFYY